MCALCDVTYAVRLCACVDVALMRRPASRMCDLGHAPRAGVGLWEGPSPLGKAEMMYKLMIVLTRGGMAQIPLVGGVSVLYLGW